MPANSNPEKPRATGRRSVDRRWLVGNHPPNKGETESERVAFAWAVSTVWWVYVKIGRTPDRLTLDPGKLVSDAAWSELLDGTGQELVQQLQPKLIPKVADYWGAPSALHAVREACISFAEAKYGQTFSAKMLGNDLAAAATIVLVGVDARATVDALHQVLEARRRAAPSQRELDRLASLLEKLRIRRSVRETVLSEAERNLGQGDRMARVLTAFFEADDGYWSRFLDHHGKPVKKKLPTLADARLDLVEAFRQPEQFQRARAHGRARTVGQSFGLFQRTRALHMKLELTARDADELAARCLKAAFPKMFPASLDGKSVKQANFYHRQMRERPPKQRPNYRG